jgi:hypothetical protein
MGEYCLFVRFHTNIIFARLKSQCIRNEDVLASFIFFGQSKRRVAIIKSLFSSLERWFELRYYSSINKHQPQKDQQHPTEGVPFRLFL